MDEEQSKEQPLGQKIGNDIQDIGNLVKDGSNLAKDIGTGNVLGIAKDGFNLLKNKKFWITLAISIFLPIIIIISLGSFVFSIFNSVGDKLQETIVDIKDFFDWSTETGIISIHDDKVDEIIDVMEKIGVSIDNLKLMGDVDYSNPKIKEENRKALRKYVKKFYEAQAATQTIYPKPNFINKLLHLGETYGSVYIHRVKGEQEVNPTDKSTILKYISYEQMEQMAASKTKETIEEIKKCFSIDDAGKLVIPYWTIIESTVSGTSVNINLKHIEYKNNISQYTTAMNFFFYLGMVTENAEFTAAVADLAKTGEIHLTVLENKNITTQVETTTMTGKQKIGPRKIYGPDGDVLYEFLPRIITRKIGPITNRTVTTSVTAQLKITYVKTWFCEQTITYNKETTGPNYSNYEYNSMNDESLKDDDEPINPGYEEKSEWWYIDKVKTVNITRQGYKYKESARTKVEDKTGEKGSQGIKDKNNNQKVDEDEKIDENTTFLGLIDNFFRIPKTDRYESVGKINLINGAEWLFHLMQKDSTLQNLEQLMRYIIFKYTGKDYGVTDFNFEIFNAKDFIEIGSGGGLKVLKEYIHSWENGSGAPKNASGTKYIVHDDGAGNPTVGYGVDIYNSGYLSEFMGAGYSTEIGSEIDIEFVDAIEEREIKSCLEQIKAYTNGLDLTGYQLNALVSRAYNCGIAGAITTYRGSPSMNFMDSYKTYWNPTKDDYFKNKNSNANFAHMLYTQYMSKPVTSASGYMLGLERRRKSEWILFQTGYYDTLNTWHSSGSGDLVSACEELTQTLIGRGARYSLSYGLISGDIERCCNEATHLCCATYVAMALYNSGLLSAEQINAYNYHWTGGGGIPDMLANAGWTQVSPSEAQPGDVINHFGVHVLVYAGDGQCWDQNSAVYSSSGRPPIGTTVGYDLNKCQIWRAP